MSIGGFFGDFVTIRLSQLRDGVSNVLAIGEQSDYAFNTNSGPAISMASKPLAGWVHGHINGVPSLQSGYQPNLTSVALPLNSKRFTGNAWPNGTPFPTDGNNTPIQSAHSGGAHVLMGDGRAKFVSEGITLDMLKMLATRDDRQSVGEY